MVECIRVLMDTFPLDIEESGMRVSPKQLEASLHKLQEGPPLYMDYLMLAFSAVTIRWAAHETGRDEKEMLDEIAKAFSGIRIE
jgi:hypothetical protein